MTFLFETLNNDNDDAKTDGVEQAYEPDITQQKRYVTKKLKYIWLNAHRHGRVCTKHKRIEANVGVVARGLFNLAAFCFFWD